MIPWIFVITMFMPSFGGDVKITVETIDEAACWKTRGALMQALRDLRKTATECAEKAEPK